MKMRDPEIGALCERARREGSALCADLVAAIEQLREERDGVIDALNEEKRRNEELFFMAHDGE